MSANEISVAVTDAQNPVVAAAVHSIVGQGYDCEPVAEAAAPTRAGIRVLVAGGITRVTSELVDSCPALEVVVRTGAGYDRVDIDALQRRRIALVAPRLAVDSSVAEYVIGALLYLSRRLDAADTAARSGDFYYRWRELGSGLADQRLGIIGMGRIGTQVATIGRCLQMDVSAWHPWSDRQLPVRRYDDFGEFLAEMDAITLHCRLTDDTRNLIDASALSSMKPSAILVNTARGGIVDERALAAALRNGTIRGAAVDNLADEPSIGASPLRDAPNSLLTPHVAGLTRQSVNKLASSASETVVAYLRNRYLPAEHLVVSGAR